MLATALTFAAWSVAYGQRASENAVTAADDAFGTTVGDERIGVYNEFDVRGFSPLQAGNIRIEGLYFDGVGDENDRLQASSRVRVGIADQGYAFPAPTGVIDYSLRTPSKNADLSVLTEGNSFGSNTLQFDGNMPLSDTLSVGGGFGYYHNAFPSGGNNFEGNYGVLMRWEPISNLEILPFWGRKDTFTEKDGEAYEPETDFLPSSIPLRHFFGPHWAKSSAFSVICGSLLNYSFSTWVARLGIFRSELSSPGSSFPYLDMPTSSQGEFDVDVNPPLRFGSTSGEFRLEKSFADGPWVHRLIFSLRGRNWNGRYGNSITIDVGPQTLNQSVDSPKPVLQFASPILDHVDERWIGFEYLIARKNWLQISLGAQKSRYHKSTLVPAQAPSVLDASPWLLTGAATGELTDKVAIFGSFTQGLEDNGITPSNAANSNEALPATTSRQKEGGVRWTLLPGANMVVTLYDLKKPYFNLDPSNIYRELGELENKGLELSLSGNLTDRFDILAGGVLSQPTVSGDAVRLGITGDRPVGIYSRKFVVDANWHPPGTKDLSFDLGVNYFGAVPGSLDDVISVPAHTTVDWDTRYEFPMAGLNASLKFAITNIFNGRSLRVLDSDTYAFAFNSVRRVNLRLIVDVG